LPAQRARLAEFDDALARLRAQYNVLMNAFKFDDARAVATRIEAHAEEWQALADTLPPLHELTPDREPTRKTPPRPGQYRARTAWFDPRQRPHRLAAT
jgi:hypothetical protein